MDLIDMKKYFKVSFLNIRCLRVKERLRQEASRKFHHTYHGLRPDENALFDLSTRGDEPGLGPKLHDLKTPSIAFLCFLQDAR